MPKERLSTFNKCQKSLVDKNRYKILRPQKNLFDTQMWKFVGWGNGHGGKKALQGVGQGTRDALDECNSSRGGSGQRSLTHGKQRKFVFGAKDAVDFWGK